LPKGPLGYARIVAENPNRKGMLFAGTGNALYYTLDDGVAWKPLQMGLPQAPVSWIVVQKEYHDLVVSTYGRGFYIMDDITPLEQGIMEPGTVTETAKLAAPRPAFRVVRGGQAQLSFWLKAPAQKPIEIEIADAKGATVRKLTVGNGRAGLNRARWDMRYEAPRQVALRTTPPENPHIWEEPRFENQQTRAITHWGLSQAEVGPIAAPGKYTVRMTVDGATQSQTLEILRTPESHGTDADLQSSVRLQLKVRDDINLVSDMTNQIEWMRKQLEDQQKTAAVKAQLLAAMDAIDKISNSIVGERQALYDRAEKLEEESQLQKTVIEAKKETIARKASDDAGAGV